MDAEVSNHRDELTDLKEPVNVEKPPPSQGVNGGGDTNESTIEEKGDDRQGSEVEDDKMSPENSEYDSAGSYSEDEQDVKVRSKASDLDEQSNSDDGGSLNIKREEGDGQESMPSKKVDDDEDKKNPQYIPKRGTFYEHDDRTAEDESNERPDAEKEKESKKKVWQDKKEKWSHDKFNDVEQAPKTRSELIAIYGYDIRNEEGPPRARRRRRYGRGPNKYTRTWEDEAAYTKAPPVIKPKKQPNTTTTNKPRRSTEEFPPLVKSEIPPNENSNQKEQTANKYQDKTEPVKENRVAQTPEPKQEQSQPRPPEPQTNRNVPQRTGVSGRIIKPKKEIKDSDYRGFTANQTRLQRNRKIDRQNVQPSPNDVIHTQNFTNKNLKNNMVDLEKEMNKLSVDAGGKVNNMKFNNSQRQGSVPPRLQSEQKGSKRYSSMRQRSLPEANTPPAVPNYQTSFYPTDYNQQAAPTTATQTLIHQANTIHHTSAQVTQIAPQSIQMPQQVPVTAAAIPLQFPVPPTAFPQAPPAAFLQPGVAPPTFISPPTPGLINYVQGQAAFPANYQEFQQQFSPVTQPAELYQPQGGITYYSTDQQVIQRTVPQKRPKAAIPIIAPPGEDKKDHQFHLQSELVEERIDVNEVATEVQQ